jgi:hypothetical protein
LHADGPGWVNTVRRGGASGPGSNLFPVSARVGPASSQAESQPDAAALTSVHVAFRRAIEGNLAKREIVFQDDVRTTYAQAREFSDLIEVKRPQDLGERGALMTSQTLTVREILRPYSRWMEMEAEGNTLVEGQTFTVRAPLVRYAGDKERITAEGSQRVEAEAWAAATAGQPPNHMMGQLFSYNVRTGEFKAEQASRIVLPNVKLPDAMKSFGAPRTPPNSSRPQR